MKLVGILNVTPDSFSDGGRYADTPAVLAQAEALAAAGAAVIDIGAESTRPGARAIGADEEWGRLADVLLMLVERLRGRALLSVDTRHAATARRALALGADWINDVSGGDDPALVQAVRESEATLVVMHHLGIPSDPGRVLPEGGDPVQAVLEWGRIRIAAIGLPLERVIFDPGIGFGKTAEQSMALVQHAEVFRGLGAEVMIGHSRKRFLAALSENRDRATLEVSRQLAGKVDYLRVHDVAGHAALLGASDV